MILNEGSMDKKLKGNLVGLSKHTPNKQENCNFCDKISPEITLTLISKNVLEIPVNQEPTQFFLLHYDCAQKLLPQYSRRIEDIKNQSTR